MQTCCFQEVPNKLIPCFHTAGIKLVNGNFSPHAKKRFEQRKLFSTNLFGRNRWTYHVSVLINFQARPEFFMILTALGKLWAFFIADQLSVCNWIIHNGWKNNDINNRWSTFVEIILVHIRKKIITLYYSDMSNELFKAHFNAGQMMSVEKTNSEAHRETGVSFQESVSGILRNWKTSTMLSNYHFRIHEKYSKLLRSPFIKKFKYLHLVIKFTSGCTY